MIMTMTNKNFKYILFFLLALIFSISIFLFLGFVYFKFTLINCLNTLTKELNINNNKNIVQIFVRNCGSTTDYSTIYKINGEEIFTMKVYMLGNISIYFKDDSLNFLCNNCDKRDVFTQEEFYENLKINYFFK